MNKIEITTIPGKTYFVISISTGGNLILLFWLNCSMIFFLSIYHVTIVISTTDAIDKPKVPKSIVNRIVVVSG